MRDVRDALLLIQFCTVHHHCRSGLMDYDRHPVTKIAGDAGQVEAHVEAHVEAAAVEGCSAARCRRFSSAVTEPVAVRRLHLNTWSRVYSGLLLSSVHEMVKTTGRCEGKEHRVFHACPVKRAEWNDRRRASQWSIPSAHTITSVQTKAKKNCRIVIVPGAE